jgi:hypothetical protein
MSLFLESKRKKRPVASETSTSEWDLAVSDVSIARRDVKERGFTLSIVRDGKTLFQSKMPGISALVNEIDTSRFDFRRASAADRVLGRAAALLLVYSGICYVFACTASEDALATLKKHGVPYECEKKVAGILNRNRSSTCPYERLVRDAETPADAFNRLRVCGVSS